MLTQAAHLSQTTPNALLGIVANRAGVNKDYIRLLNLIGVEVTLLLHYGNHNLGVADIHLTTVGFDKEFATLT
jgi:hypothetical protein